MRHPNPHRSRAPLAAAVLLGLLALAHLWQGFESANLLLRSLQNSLHLPAFAVLGFFVAALFNGLRPVAVFFICLGMAIVLESAQVMTERDASLADLAVDGAGIILGLLIARGHGGVRLGGVLIVAIATVWWPVRVWHSKSVQNEMFPVLLDSRLVGTPFLESDSSLERTDDNRVRVCLADVAYPGVLVSEPSPQWRGYETLAMRFTVEGGEALRMNVAIGYLSTPGTSATVSDVFAPGTHTWEIPVSELQAEGELVSYFKVHSTQRYVGQCFALESVGLKRAGE